MSASKRLKVLLPTVGIMGLLAVFTLAMESTLGIGPLARQLGVNLIIPLLTIVIVMTLYSCLIKKNDIWLVFERIGVLVGILFSVIFLLSVVNGVFGNPGKEHLTYTFAILIVGCFISVVGYVAKQESIVTAPHTISLNTDIGFIALIIIIIAITLELLTGIEVFIDTTSLIITLSPAAALLLTNYKKASARRYMQTVVIGVTGALFVCVMAWTLATERDTADAIGPTIAISLLSMTYGVLVILISACICSDANAEKIDFGKLNWHLLEVFALIILMVFAPESVWEWAARVNPSPT